MDPSFLFWYTPRDASTSGLSEVRIEIRRFQTLRAAQRLPSVPAPSFSHSRGVLIRCFSIGTSLSCPVAWGLNHPSQNRIVDCSTIRLYSLDRPIAASSTQLEIDHRASHGPLDPCAGTHRIPFPTAPDSESQEKQHVNRVALQVIPSLKTPGNTSELAVFAGLEGVEVKVCDLEETPKVDCQGWRLHCNSATAPDQ